MYRTHSPFFAREYLCIDANTKEATLTSIPVSSKTENKDITLRAVEAANIYQGNKNKTLVSLPVILISHNAWHPAILTLFIG